MGGVLSIARVSVSLFFLLFGFIFNKPIIATEKSSSDYSVAVFFYLNLREQSEETFSLQVLLMDTQFHAVKAVRTHHL